MACFSKQKGLVSVVLIPCAICFRPGESSEAWSRILNAMSHNKSKVIISKSLNHHFWRTCHSQKKTSNKQFYKKDLGIRFTRCSSWTTRFFMFGIRCTLACLSAKADFSKSIGCGITGRWVGGSFRVAVDTVDGRNPAFTSWTLVVYPIIYRVLAPSQVVIAGFLNHQQYQYFW